MRGLILLITFACSATAFAQGGNPFQHRQFGGGLFGGTSLGKDLQFSTMVSGSAMETSRTVGMHYASGYLLGIRGVENLGDFWVVDLEYSFANQPLHFTNLSPEIQNLPLSHSVHHFSYNASYLPRTPAQRLRPYARIGAGAGLFYIRSDSKDEARALGLPLRDSWTFAVNLGGGLKYLLHDQAALTFDVKDRMSSVPSYGLPRSARVVDGRYQPGISTTGILHQWQINIGVEFQWDEQ